MERIAAALERMSPAPLARPDFGAASAFVWHVEPDRLEPVARVNRIDLPLLLGISMWLQQKLNPAPADPVQAKVMQIMPIMFTVFFAFFPSGLVLYWVTNTVLSIAQQWKINRVVEAEAKAQKGGKKKD